MFYMTSYLWYSYNVLLVIIIILYCCSFILPLIRLPIDDPVYTWSVLGLKISQGQKYGEYNAELQNWNFSSRLVCSSEACEDPLLFAFIASFDV